MNHVVDLYERACKHIPGGVNSPVRAFRGVGGTPVFIARADGAYVVDNDGNRYIDYVGSWGPMLHGHNHPAVREAVVRAAQNGLSFGAPTVIEVEMAERISQLVPSMEQVRMVNSGTEATMSAVRLARGVTGRDLIVKFEGCYHGHGDSFLVEAGSGALTLGIPNSPGVPSCLAELTLTVPFNDPEAVAEVFARRGDEIACVIVEPVAGNMNCIPPRPGFLAALRRLCDTHGGLLIFDEVMTGFRVARGGAQSLYDVRPDLTTLGKVVGGGMPVGAFGGRRDIMQRLAPEGDVYQAGTLSGNPVAMAAGLANLALIDEEDFYPRLAQRTETLARGLVARAADNGISLCENHVGGMFGIFFTDADEVTGFQGAAGCDLASFKRFFHAMLERGVYLAPSAFEAGFVSAAHGEKELARTLEAAADAFAAIGAAPDPSARDG